MSDRMKISLGLGAAACAALLAFAATAPAVADSHDTDSGGKQLRLGQGDSGGGHDDGHDDGDHEDGHESGGKHGGEEGGHEPIGGNKAGQGQGGQGGGKPVWAQEGIPEVELGRLNVARSPDQVLDRAFEEAKATFSASMAEFYQNDLDGMIAELSLNWDNVDFIDSPLQNLSMLRDSLDGTSVLRTVGITTDTHILQAVFLGTASDKNIPISTETALAISAILGQPLSQAAAEALAQDAEKIRIAILAGHG